MQKKISQIYSIENDIIDDIEHIMDGKLKNKVVNDRIDPTFLPEFGKKLGFLSDQKIHRLLLSSQLKAEFLKQPLLLIPHVRAALHGIKTLVIGLDMQCDISNAIMPSDNMEHLDFDDQLQAMSETRGLFDFYQGDMQISDLIMPSDLEYLHLIPETPELVLLNDHIGNLNRREFWLNDRVISKLRNVYDLIILDCSPSWNRLITNALCVTDLLVSPVECKINNLRNVEVFNQLLDEFKTDMRINFSHCLVPTKYSPQKKLSKEIYDWYLTNFENTLPHFIRESVISEEAMP